MISSVYLQELESIVEAKNKNNIIVHCVFDNEEVGSGTKQGAGIHLLKGCACPCEQGTWR